MSGSGGERTVLTITPGRSTLRVSARSNVGPIEFSSAEVSGNVTVKVGDDGIDVTDAPAASLQVAVMSLSSGNALYDAEVRQRLHAQRYPTIRAELGAAHPLAGGRFALDGTLTIHGATRSLTGTVQLTAVDPHRLVVEGEQVVDMRDFDIRLPSALMLRIYPDVTVSFRLEATAD